MFRDSAEPCRDAPTAPPNDQPKTWTGDPSPGANSGCRRNAWVESVALNSAATQGELQADKAAGNPEPDVNTLSGRDLTAHRIFSLLLRLSHVPSFAAHIMSPRKRVKRDMAEARASSSKLSPEASQASSSARLAAAAGSSQSSSREASMMGSSQPDSKQDGATPEASTAALSTSSRVGPTCPIFVLLPQPCYRNYR